MYFGILITVCEKAEEKCPTLPGLGERQYWPVEDPVVIEGSEEEKLEAFRRARDEIKQHILDWLESRQNRKERDD
jgi:arsenate reductase